MFKSAMLYMYNFVLMKSQVKHQPFLFQMDSVLMKDAFAEVMMEDLLKKSTWLPVAICCKIFSHLSLLLKAAAMYFFFFLVL